MMDDGKETLLEAHQFNPKIKKMGVREDDTEYIYIRRPGASEDI